MGTIGASEDLLDGVIVGTLLGSLFGTLVGLGLWWEHWLVY